MHLFTNLGGRPKVPHYFFYCSVAERQAEKLVNTKFCFDFTKDRFLVYLFSVRLSSQV